MTYGHIHMAPNCLYVVGICLCEIDFHTLCLCWLLKLKLLGRLIWTANNGFGPIP